MRLLAALGASTALHLSVALIPPGNLTSVDFATNSPPHRASAAPISVRLGATTLRVPALSAVEMAAQSSAQPSAAPALDESSDAFPAKPEAIQDEGSTSHGGQAGFGIPGPPRYYNAKEVTKHAEVIGEIEEFSSALMLNPDSGRLILALRINEAGTVDGVDVEASYVSPTLRDIIVGQFGHARFLPAQKDGKPVKSRMKIEVVVTPPVSVQAPTGASEAGS
jgi:hypothetical protein